MKVCYSGKAQIQVHENQFSHLNYLNRKDNIHLNNIFLWQKFIELFK